MTTFKRTLVKGERQKIKSTIMALATISLHTTTKIERLEKQKSRRESQRVHLINIYMYIGFYKVS